MVRIGRFDIYWVRVRHGESKHLVIYRQRRNGTVARWEL